MYDPCYSGFQVQGAATSPICMALFVSLIILTIDIHNDIIISKRIGYCNSFLPNFELQEMTQTDIFYQLR